MSSPPCFAYEILRRAEALRGESRNPFGARATVIPCKSDHCYSSPRRRRWRRLTPSTRPRPDRIGEIPFKGFLESSWAHIEYCVCPAKREAKAQHPSAVAG